MAEPAAGDVRLATGFVLCSMTSVQLGAALATTLFGQIGPGGAVLMRGVFGAVALLVLSRRALPSLRDGAWVDLLVFGFIFAGLNFVFYAAIERIPLGVVVTIEFIGPLAIAVAASRRRIDLAWTLLAAVGIVLLSGGISGDGLQLGGVLLALLAGCFWAAYILQSARVGSRHTGLGALAVAMAMSTIFLAPFGIAQGGVRLLHPATLLAGIGVGILASAIPYGLEHEALRRMPKNVFGILMSLEPAIAAVVGLIALSQHLSVVEMLAIVLVVIASGGALYSTGTPPLDA